MIQKKRKKGQSISEIAEALELDEETVRKFMEMEAEIRETVL